eukprot:RCo005323
MPLPTAEDIVLNLARKNGPPPGSAPKILVVGASSPTASAASGSRPRLFSKTPASPTNAAATAATKPTPLALGAMGTNEGLSYTLQTHDSNGNPIWLAKSPFESPKKGPAWQHDEDDAHFE